MKLSKTEAHILSTLEQANGAIVHRSELKYPPTQGRMEAKGSNSLEVLISRLRKKLEGRSIQTVRGYGYRLVTP